MKAPLKGDCFVTSVALLGLRHLGPESMAYEPEILRDAFKARFDMQRMSQKLFDKLNCGYMLVGTDAFVSTIEGFLTATAIMNNLVFEEDEIPYCTLRQCAWSVWEYINLMGEIKDGQPTEVFCPEIIEYIREAGKLNGVSQFPQWLAFANPPNGALPDLTGDISLFEMYQARQQDYIRYLNGFVAKRQDDLTQELLDLQQRGLIG